VEKIGVELEANLYHPLDLVDGHFSAPSGPGLGVDPDPDVIRECRIAS
jgi:L-alanine-DL-glutamate epimerase-like enolase superfamily enzyme